MKIKRGLIDDQWKKDYLLRNAVDKNFPIIRWVEKPMFDFVAIFPDNQRKKKAYHLISWGNWQLDVVRMISRFQHWSTNVSESTRQSFEGAGVTVAIDERILLYSSQSEKFGMMEDNSKDNLNSYGHFSNHHNGPGSETDLKLAFQTIKRVMNVDFHGKWHLYPIKWTDCQVLEQFLSGSTDADFQTSSIPLELIYDNELRFLISTMHPAFPARSISDPSISLIMCCYRSVNEMILDLMEQQTEDRLFQVCGVDYRDSQAIYQYLRNLKPSKLKLLLSFK